MYELPSSEGVSRVIVDEQVINGITPPILIFEQDEIKTIAAGSE
jgi:ATP-dependent Clp protease ATP-binding subunit ClpX